MGSCQSMQSEVTQEIAATLTSSKRVTNKNPQSQSEMIMSNEYAKIESELQADEELFSMNIYTSVKKDKQSYNFQEEELSTIKTSPQQIPVEFKESGKQKRKRYRTSLTHQEFKLQLQDRDPLGLSLQLGNDQDSNSKSYKSILKKNSNIKSMSGSPIDNNRRSVHFAGGTNFRSKSQRSIKRSTKVLNQPSSFKQQSQKSSKLATDGRSPLRKQQRSQDGIQDRHKKNQDLQIFGKPRINYILF